MTTHDISQPTDVLIIGAGPAGSAAASIVHAAGLSVRVLEATRFPRFVIGESLLPHCMDILEEAGLLEAAKACNFLVKNGALFYRGPQRCSFSFAEQFTKGWTWTWQVPRAEFDLALAREVEHKGIPIHWEHKVLAASLAGEPRLSVQAPDGGLHEVRARFVIDASGYGRVLPRLLDIEEPSHLPTRQALFTHVTGDKRPPGPDEGRIWICVHPGQAWIWIIPFSDGRTSVGGVGEPSFFERFPEDKEARLRALLAAEPNAAERLKDTKFLFEPEIIRGYSISVKQLYGENYCLVGNATEFLDPVFSSGVTLALESASRAANTVIKQLAGKPVDWKAEYADHMMRGIDVFRTFVTRWYDGTLPDLFFAAQQDEAIRAQMCSVLAGYVWDEQNPIVQQHARRIPQLARLVRDGGPAPRA